MRHEIQLEEFERESDGHHFARVTMRDLAGSDRLLIVCTADTAKDALLQLAHRLRLVAEDALDISWRIFERYGALEEKTNSSSQRPELRLVDPEQEGVE